jgi:heptaprenyl diphosphate synthase
VRSYAESARSELGALPAGAARDALESMCDFISDRTS